MASYRRFKPRPARRPIEDPRPLPLPGAVVDAVLRFHDEEHDQGAGRTLLRLSQRRLAERDVAQALGEPPAPPASRSSGTSAKARSSASSRRREEANSGHDT
jgi:hypothetical protein